MKKLCLSIISFILVITISVNAFAKPFNPADYTSVDEHSELLPKGVSQSKASEHAVFRGDFFVSADLMMTDKGDGNIGALAVAYMQYPVDEVYISIYLDRLDEESGRWRQVTYYDAEFYKKDFPDGLKTPSVDIVFQKQSKGEYYRLRGVFAAYSFGEVEGFSPTTAGIKLEK